jgi:hypothetical protein
MYTLKEFDYITSNEHQIEEQEESVTFHLFFNFTLFLCTQSMRDNHTLVNLLNTIQKENFYVFTNIFDFKKNMYSYYVRNLVFISSNKYDNLEYNNPIHLFLSY